MRISIGTYEHTLPLKDGRVTSPRLDLQFVDFNPANRAFRPMATDLAFDISELALTTYLLARAMGRPLVGLPIVLHRAPLLSSVHTLPESALRGPLDLSGRTIGVRAYTQTTGTWVRGLLQDLFGLDPQTLNWVTFEGAHVEGYRDPPNCRRAPSGKVLLGMLRHGEIDAAVGLTGADTEGLREVVPNAELVQADWSARTSIHPVNHILTMRRDVLEANPWLAAELTSLLQASFNLSSRSAEPAGAGARIGLAGIRSGIETMARYAHEQGITPHQLAEDEIFDA